jgi:Na+-driven multidrug efflux pump
MGSAIAIMIGQQLGAGDIEGAKKTNSKLIFLSFTIHVTIGLIIVALSGVIPNIYKVAPQVRELTSSLLVVAGLVLPLNSLVHAIYFTIRTGGKTIITFLFDCVFTWTVSVPLVYVLCHFTALPIVAVYTCVQLSVMIKIIVGLPIVISGKWARNIVYDIEATAL